MESTSVGRVATAVAPTDDTIGKTGVMKPSEVKSALDTRLYDVDKRVYIVHTPHSRRLSKEKILKELCKVTKCIGKPGDVFPIRNSSVCFNNLGETSHCLELFVDSGENYEKVCKFFVSGNLFIVEGHTLEFKIGRKFDESIVEKLQPKLVLVRGVPIECFFEVLEVVKSEYAEVVNDETDACYSTDGTVSVQIKSFKAPVPKFIEVNKNGYTLRMSVEIKGWTQADVVKFRLVVNRPQPNQPRVFQETKDVWKSGPAKRQRVIQCYFCKQFGHTKHACLEWIEWNERLATQKCRECGVLGHYAKHCPSKGERKAAAREIASKVVCYECGETGHKRHEKKCDPIRMRYSEVPENDGFGSEHNLSVVNALENIKLGESALSQDGTQSVTSSSVKRKGSTGSSSGTFVENNQKKKQLLEESSRSSLSEIPPPKPSELDAQQPSQLTNESVGNRSRRSTSRNSIGSLNEKLLASKSRK